METSRFPVEKLRSLSILVTKGETPLWRGDSYLESGIPFLRGKNIKEGSIIFEDLVFIDEEVHRRMKRSILNDDLLLLTMAGTLGDVAYFKKEFPESNINQDIAKIRLKERISYEYAVAYFQTALAQSQVNILSNGGTRSHLNFEQIKTFKVVVPPFEVQQRVTSIFAEGYEQKRRKEVEAQAMLDSIDDYVLNELNISVAGERPEKIEGRMFKLGARKLQEGRFDPFYHLPKFVSFIEALKRLGDLEKISTLGKVICGPFGSAVLASDYKEKGVPLIRIGNINSSQQLVFRNVAFLTDELANELSQYTVKLGDVVVSQRGTLGLSAVVTEEFNNAVISANIIAIKNLRSVTPEYLNEFLRTKLGQIQIQRSTSGQVQPKITTDVIKSVLVPVMPFERQKEMVGIISNIRAKAHSLLTESTRELEQIKQEIEHIILGEQS